LSIINHQFGIRTTVDTRQLESSYTREQFEERSNKQAMYRLVDELFASGRFKLENVTQKSMEIYRERGEVNHLVEDYLNKGLEVYEGRVFIFTAEELREIISNELTQERERILASLRKLTDGQ
jgi:hypothetical protein